MHYRIIVDPVITWTMAGFDEVSENKSVIRRGYNPRLQWGTPVLCRIRNYRINKLKLIKPRLQ